MSLELPLAQVGLSHRTASLAWREVLAREADALGADLAAAARPGDGFLLLLTCNRIECYAVGSDAVPARFAERARVLAPAGEAVLPLVRRGPAALRHLVRVTAGLESLVPGEREVVGQVRAAWRRARERGWATGELDRLVAGALAAGQRVRAAAFPSGAARSVATAAVARARRERGGSLAGARCVVAGAGTVARGLVEALRGEGAQVVVVARRARRGVAAVEPWSALAPALAGADVGFVATGASRPTVDRALLAEAAAGRAAPLLLLDLAVPRNVDPAGAAGVRLLDVEALASRPDAMPRADGLLDDEVAALVRAWAARAVTRRLGHLHAEGDQLAASAATALLAGLPPLGPEGERRVHDALRQAVRRALFPASREARSLVQAGMLPLATCERCPEVSGGTRGAA